MLYKTTLKCLCVLGIHCIKSLKCLRQKSTLDKLVMLLENSKVYKTMEMAVDRWLTSDCAQCCAWRQVPTLQSHSSTLTNFYCVWFFFLIFPLYDEQGCRSHCSWRRSCVKTNETCLAFIYLLGQKSRF